MVGVGRLVGRAGLPDVRGFRAFRARIRATLESGFEGGAVKRLPRPAPRGRYFRFGIKTKSDIRIQPRKIVQRM